MEFEGRILKVLPVRIGTSSKGEWKALPFVFEYFETDDQRWSDKVLLETMEPSIMGKIGAFVERGADNKGIVENGCMKLKGEIKCRCGFSHSVREWTDKDGKTSHFNQVRLYKFEIMTEQRGQQTAGNSAGTAAASMIQPTSPFPPFPPQSSEGGQADDLPF